MTRVPRRFMDSIKLNGCSAVASARHATNETIVVDREGWSIVGVLDEWGWKPYPTLGNPG